MLVGSEFGLILANIYNHNLNEKTESSLSNLQVTQSWSGY